MHAIIQRKSNQTIREIAHRIQYGWQKFGKCSIPNKNVSIKLRLKLFDSTVNPNILFGLCALPISQQNMSKNMVTQRKCYEK